MGFLGGVIVPYIYMITLVLWMPPNNKARVQFLVGLVIYFFTGPFLTIGVLFYTIYHLDSFSWGKTRRVIAENNDSNSTMECERGLGLDDEEAIVGVQ